jgi:outer membrane protein OmpA-like peptidoglycan-associated protein
MKTIVAIFLIMIMAGFPSWSRTADAESAAEFQRLKIAAEEGDGLKPKQAKIIPKGVILQKIKEEGQVAFESDSIRFGLGSAVVEDGVAAQLAEIIAALADCEEFKDASFFYVDGHCCNIGSDENNCRLSFQRAKNVIEMIAKSGEVPESKLKARGFGYRVPTASNDSEEERKRNRRVVLRGPKYPGAEDESQICTDSGSNANTANNAPVTPGIAAGNDRTFVEPVTSPRDKSPFLQKSKNANRDQSKTKAPVGQKDPGAPPPTGSIAEKNQDPNLPPGFVKGNTGR